MYVSSVGGRLGHDQYVHVHSNRVTVIGITALHPIVSSGVAVVSALFVAGKDKATEVKVRCSCRGSSHLYDNNVSPLTVIYIHWALRDAVDGHALELTT